jgi:hypothetical protein
MPTAFAFALGEDLKSSFSDGMDTKHFATDVILSRQLVPMHDCAETCSLKNGNRINQSVKLFAKFSSLKSIIVPPATTLTADRTQWSLLL